MRKLTFAAAIAMTMLTLAPAALAATAEPLELYPSPKTDVARSVEGLFNLTFAIAMIIFVGVEAFLFFVIWKFRHNKTTPAGETHRGHTKAEIAWTVIPAAILLVLGTVSAAELFKIDPVPEKTDFTIRVVAERFTWTFIYPDDGVVVGNTTTRDRTFNQMRVEEGKTVAIDITSKDVEHQLFIPAFAIKISAIPGRVNHQWFIAPAPGDYHLECTMYCGVGHHVMGANSDDTRITVFAKGSQPLPYGKAPAAPAS